jgi:diguanylate cyclase (GGDEF)-like protein
MFELFRTLHVSKKEQEKYQASILNQSNQTNAKRAVYVLFLGVIVELVLILFYDIANIVANGWLEGYGIYYLSLHLVVLLVSAGGFVISRTMVVHPEKVSVLGVSFTRISMFIGVIFLSAIAAINGLDQLHSDSITIYVFFALIIAVFVVLHPLNMLIVLAIPHAVFILGQLLYVTNQQILISNITNATFAVLTSYFISYFLYHNFIDYHIATIKLEETTAQLEVLSVTDQLTGIHNRRKYDESIIEELARSNRTKLPFALLMFDIDLFKHINDTHGHQVGDKVLRGLAEFVAKQIRQEDTFARYGGEEFILILTNTNAEKARLKAEALREGIKAVKMIQDIHISISIGVTEYQPNDTTDAILKRVDNALYEAKETGRDKVVVR